MSNKRIKNIFFLMLMLASVFAVSCSSNSKSGNGNDQDNEIKVYRFDKLQSRYLTTGDFSALQIMSTDYPVETRTLIEDILKIGKVTESDINSRFLHYFQDSVLQELISDTEAHFADMTLLNNEFTTTFNQLKKELPNIQTPVVYAQIGALSQSIIINNNTIGISLDKYLGADYPLYKKYYNKTQRKDMNDKYIVPNALAFYLISIYPLKDYQDRSQIEHDLYMGKIMWVINHISGKNKPYNTVYVKMVNNYMHKYKNISVQMLLENNDFEEIIKTNRE